jgi:hypothetical protein
MTLPVALPAEPGPPWRAAEWGLASLALGCTLMVMAPTMLVLNTLLFTGGAQRMRPTDVALARIGIFAGTGAVFLLGLAGLTFGVIGLGGALRHKQPAALGLGGTLASLVGLLLWGIAGANALIVILSVP